MSDEAIDILTTIKSILDAASKSLHAKDYAELLGAIEDEATDRMP